MVLVMAAKAAAVVLLESLRDAGRQLGLQRETVFAGVAPGATLQNASSSPLFTGVLQAFVIGGAQCFTPHGLGIFADARPSDS
jgi:hypothetical protein